MMSRGSTGLAFLAIAVATMAAAQEATTQPTATSGPSATTETAAADPTQPDQRLRTFLNPPAATRPAVEKPALARITKRAFLQTENSEPEALIEVEGGGTVSVKKGSTVSVPTHQGKNVTIHVVKLSPDEIEIEVPATGEKITIR